MLTFAEQPEMQAPVSPKRRFQLVLIKPSHYGDNGYVIRWWRAMVPSNSLAAVYAIAADCAEQEAIRRVRKAARKQAQRDGLIPMPKRREDTRRSVARPRPF
jgi:hypothetical protein